MKELTETTSRNLTKAEFQHLADVPPEAEWFANIRNENTRRAYRKDVQEFAEFLGLAGSDEFRLVTRAHIIAWRKEMETRELAASTIRRKLAAVSALFAYLCEANAVPDNPVHGVARPKEGSNEGKTPALGDAQARKILDAPPESGLKGLRDRAILAILLYHAIRRDEICKLRMRDRQTREGIPHLVIRGKGDKLRYVPLHPHASRLIDAYLDELDPARAEDSVSPLFRPVKNNRTGSLTKPLSGDAIYKIIKTYGLQTGVDFEIDGLSPHVMRATAATNALSHEADIAKVQEWLGHASIATTRLYDRRQSKPEDSPTFRVKY
jgi:integrase/recombinase XerD